MIETSNLKTNHKDIRKEVFSSMLKRKGKQNRAFLRYLRIFKYFAFSLRRGAFLENYYLLMRCIDDIVDGDAPLPEGYLTAEAFVLDKIAFAANPVTPNDEYDALLLHCYDIGDSFLQNFQEETQDILGSLLFDARRIEKLQVYSKKELWKYFHEMDVRGTIRATLKIFKEDPEKYKYLEPLGNACRVYYNLRDFEEDIRAGYVNIPKEDMERFGIRKVDLSNKDHPAIRNWFIDQAELGMQLLAKHHLFLKQCRFSCLARATFSLVYEKSAKDYFIKVLNENK
ncbi:MAG: class 1 isoprenoid biosynthesis enzyme [Bacteroidetes bacterium]|nr:class 1 isoprenoid biosynthesis enzyme [Bacteroidota bacterium]